MDAVIPELDYSLIPAPGLWNGRYDATAPSTQTQKVMNLTDSAEVTAETGISPIPPSLAAGYDSAMLMQTKTDSVCRPTQPRTYLSISPSPIALYT